MDTVRPVPRPIVKRRTRSRAGILPWLALLAIIGALAWWGWVKTHPANDWASKLLTATVTRGEREVASLGAGDFFGELALFDPAPRNATVTAVSQVSMVSLHRDAFRRALDETPAMRDALLHGMAQRLHQLDAHA